MMCVGQLAGESGKEGKVGLEGCSLPSTKAGTTLAQALAPGAPVRPKHQILNVSGFMGSIGPRSDTAQMRGQTLGGKRTWNRS